MSEKLPTSQNVPSMISSHSLQHCGVLLVEFTFLAHGSVATLSLHLLTGRMGHNLSHRFRTEGLTQMIEGKRKENAEEITSRGHPIAPWRELVYIMV